jgi:DMSO/TMAO reductase YedYZ molybdopterin-dependent catalytic subunit
LSQAASLDDLRAFPARTQITRHDCVEGWSCIGKWTGVQLSVVLQRAGLKPDAKYIVSIAPIVWVDTWSPNKYYESIDLIDAFHPQTILAYDMNGAPLEPNAPTSWDYSAKQLRCRSPGAALFLSVFCD